MEQGEERKAQTWMHRMRDWLRRPPATDRAGSGQSSPESRLPSAPLSDRELESLKRAYLQRLCQRSRSLYVYGLDAHRQTLQASGQTLDLQAIYTPLNTTLPAPPQDSPAPSTPAPRGSPDTRPELPRQSLSALEAVGGQERAILRGPRGSGKSTFVRFLALALAERSPDGICTGVARLGPAWAHGCPLPLWVDLRAFAGSPHNNGSAAGLSRYIADELHISADQLIGQLVAPGGLLVMLDGIEMALDTVTDFYRRFEQTPNRFVLTTQTFVDLSGEAQRPLQDMAEIELAPWTLDEMGQFAGRWFAELERREWIDSEAARDMPGQLCSALRRQEVMALARRPSLMTLIALLHTAYGQFPSGRVAFYRQLIGLCITRWSEGRTELERDLRQAFDLETLRAALAEATYNRYARLEDPADRVEFSVSDLRAILINVCQDGRMEAVDTLVTRMRTRPGYLDERSAGVYIYTRPDLQVHAAAHHLVLQPDLPHLVVSLAHEDYARWREVILLAGMRLAELRDDLPAALALVGALCPRLPSDPKRETAPDIEWRLAWLAGEMLAEIAQANKGPIPSQTLNCVEAWLVALLEGGMLSPSERTKAGSVLDRLPDGDRRPGVSAPNPLWCQVPAGDFWQGETQAAETVHVGTFWMSRYPVTNAQYAAFVRATGRPAPSHWQGEHPPAGVGNRPVVHVTWQEANQYCAWCTGRLFSEPFLVWRSYGAEALERAPGNVPRDWVVRLPTSQEWEKAARGGLQIPGAADTGETASSVFQAALMDNPLPRRTYPWGDGWQLSTSSAKGDETRCNVSESGIGTPTPVGMYPGGASPYGLMDMAGNVWEWCLGWADEQRRYKIRRGGAFRFTHEHARCAAYDKAHPGLGWPHLGFRVVLAPPQR
jgi:formylglycine-generating enzyme required for sulfatase activity/energy-coupling factor transporter ATP-binding protein EcfA2